VGPTPRTAACGVVSLFVGSSPAGFEPTYFRTNLLALSPIRR